MTPDRRTSVLFRGEGRGGEFGDGGERWRGGFSGGGCWGVGVGVGGRVWWMNLVVVERGRPCAST